MVKNSIDGNNSLAKWLFNDDMKFCVSGPADSKVAKH